MQLCWKTTTKNKSLITNIHNENNTFDKQQNVRSVNNSEYKQEAVKIALWRRTAATLEAATTTMTTTFKTMTTAITCVFDYRNNHNHPLSTYLQSGWSKQANEQKQQTSIGSSRVVTVYIRSIGKLKWELWYGNQSEKE